VARCAPALYPAPALAQAAIRVLRRRPELLVTASSPRGNPEFRAILARRAVGLGLTLSPDELQITNGCIEALNLALRAVAQPGDTIAVESPTFYGLLQVLESLGLQALEIPTSPQTGLSLEALELAIQAYANIKAVVVVPYLQNPLGSIMPDSHKQALVELCEAHAIALIEDDCYSELVNERRRGEAPMRAMKSWDKTGNVIYCASLHKILAPGLRLGWMAAGRWQARVEMLKYVQTRSNERLSQLAVADFMATPAFERHLRRLRSVLQAQRENTAELIARYFPPGTRLNVPDGGLALWIELPQKLSSRRVFEAALQEQILVAPGLMFSNSLRFDAYLRISCGWPLSTEVEQALCRLGQIVQNLLDQSQVDDKSASSPRTISAGSY
jgi:DNA-binding transcriptional MocR family regulator